MLVERLLREGAPLRLGTDVQQPFVVPGAAMHREMQLFVDAGIRPAEVFRLAPREAALACGLHDLGTTRRGATANLLVLERDPTADIEALSSIRAVVHRGSLFERTDLQREIKDDLSVRERAFQRISSSIVNSLVCGGKLDGRVGLPSRAQTHELTRGRLELRRHATGMTMAYKPRTRQLCGAWGFRGIDGCAAQRVRDVSGRFRG